MISVELADQFILDLRVVDGARRVRGATGTHGWVDCELAAECARTNDLIAARRRPSPVSIQTNGAELGQQAKVGAGRNIGKELIQAGGGGNIHKASPKDLHHVDVRDDRSSPVLNPALV